MFPLFQWLQDTRFPVEHDMNLPWSHITFPIAGDLNLPWSHVEIDLPFADMNNHLPLSGAVNQNIETEWAMSENDRALNKKLFEEAGPWGNQLATMMEALRALMDEQQAASPKAAAANPENEKALAAFTALHDCVRKVQDDHRNECKAKARDQLDTLMAQDPDAARDLLRACAAKLDGEKDG